MKSIAEALRKSGGLVPSDSAYRASMISAPGVRIGARTLITLEESMQSMRCYEIENHKPKASQLRHRTVIKNFKLEFDDLKYRKKKEVSTPQISQKLDVVRWTETFLDLLSMIVGACNVPLSCFV